MELLPGCNRLPYSLLYGRNSVPLVVVTHVEEMTTGGHKLTPSQESSKSQEHELSVALQLNQLLF